MTKLNSIQQLVNFTTDTLKECIDVKSVDVLKRNIEHWKKHNDIDSFDVEMIEALTKLENDLEKINNNALIISANELNARFLSEIRVVPMLKDPESVRILVKDICDRYKLERKLWGEEFGEENFQIQSFQHVSGVLNELGID